MRITRLTLAMALAVALSVPMNAQNTSTTQVVRKAGDVAATLRRSATTGSAQQGTTQTTEQQNATTQQGTAVQTQTTQTGEQVQATTEQVTSAAQQVAAQQVTTAEQAAAKRGKTKRTKNNSQIVPNNQYTNPYQQNATMNQNVYGSFNIVPAHNGGFIMPLLSLFPLAITPEAYGKNFKYGDYVRVTQDFLQLIIGGKQYYYGYGIYLKLDKSNMTIISRPPVGSLLDPKYYNDAECVTFSISSLQLSNGYAYSKTGRNILLNGKTYAFESKLNNDIYYFHKDGVFFVIDYNGNYVVVTPPLGTIVTKLPNNNEFIRIKSEIVYIVESNIYREVSIDGNNYYEIIGYVYND